MLNVVVFGAICEVDNPAKRVTYRVDPIRYAEWLHRSVKEKSLGGDESAITEPEDNVGRNKRRFWKPYHVSCEKPHLWRSKLRHARTILERASWHKARGQVCKIDIMLTEFANLSDGTRVVLRNDRGFTLDMSEMDHSKWPGHTPENLVEHVHMILLPVDREYYSERYYSPEEIVGRVRCLHGIEIDPESVRAATPPPLIVEFGSGIFGSDWPHRFTRSWTEETPQEG